MSINDRDLYNRHNQMVNLKKQTYEKVYNRCVASIKKSAANGDLLCFFIIPDCMFGLGYPIINIEYCANYVINKLEKANKNLKASFIKPNVIFIDWRI